MDTYQKLSHVAMVAARCLQAPPLQGAEEVVLWPGHSCGTTQPVALFCPWRSVGGHGPDRNDQTGTAWNRTAWHSAARPRPEPHQVNCYVQL